MSEADTGNWASAKQVTFRHPLDRILDCRIYCVIEDAALDFLENRVNVHCPEYVRIYQEVGTHVDILITQVPGHHRHLYLDQVRNTIRWFVYVDNDWLTKWLVTILRI